MDSPSISVVVNTYNRATTLENTLNGLRQLAYDNFEVVVVNGPSTDSTADIMKKWDWFIKPVFCEAANLSVSRNLGIAAAAGEVVAFIDDDAIPHPTWLSRLAPSYADERVGGVGGFTVDNTGIRFQCRKTICDRFGNAFHVSPTFDERSLNFAGTPFYPSLLGTNSSFRYHALKEIGGFDHTYAYLLDETDVCLRIVDAGYRIIYEPSALVFHQFAASHIRTPRRIARTIYPSATSKAYFIIRHGSSQSVEEAGHQLAAYKEEMLLSNKAQADGGDITPDHRISLDQDLIVGLQEGVERAFANSSRSGGDLPTNVSPPPFKRAPAWSGWRIALVSQQFAANNEAGISRWTSMLATGLAMRGHAVHVICRSEATPTTQFKDGYWIHAVEDDHLLGEIVSAKHAIPLGLAARAAAVRKATQHIKTFGLDVLSFPIWDLEGIACLDDPSLTTMMSLHTTYALAKPYKEEWNLRPLFEHFAINPVIAAENRLLGSVRTIVANSKAVVHDLEKVSGIEFSERATLCLHGTTDPFEKKPSRRTLRTFDSNVVKILYVGRFEERKGFDLAALAISNVLRAGSNVHIDILGDDFSQATAEWLARIGASNFKDDSRISLHGKVDRESLDDFFSAADIVLMPSKYESFGLVAIEAMAAGAPIVALRVGGLAEVIEDGTSGILVEPGDKEVVFLTSALRKLIDDPGLRRAMSEGARSCFENRYTTSDMIDSFEDAIRYATQTRT